MNVMTGLFPQHKVWTSDDILYQTEYAVTQGTIMANWFVTELDMNYTLPKLGQSKTSFKQYIAQRS